MPSFPTLTPVRLWWVTSGCSRGMARVQFSEKEIAAITEIAHQPDPFGLVVASVCPGIFGHEMVKAGLILGLFGGSQADGGSVRSLSSTAFRCVSLGCDAVIVNLCARPSRLSS